MALLFTGRAISVSADGSTWFLGLAGTQRVDRATLFQYPLMDRLGFWGRRRADCDRGHSGFQYPLMDRLGFWGRSRWYYDYNTFYFSIR